MKKLRCNICYGSGQIMGGGMIMQPCDNCDGVGKISINEESYNEAKEKIKSLDDKITEQEATNILDTELRKTTNVKSGRKDGKEK